MGGSDAVHPSLRPEQPALKGPRAGREPVHDPVTGWPAPQNCLGAGGRGKKTLGRHRGGREQWPTHGQPTDSLILNSRARRFLAQYKLHAWLAMGGLALFPAAVLRAGRLVPAGPPGGSQPRRRRCVLGSWLVAPATFLQCSCSRRCSSCATAAATMAWRSPGSSRELFRFLHRLADKIRRAAAARGVRVAARRPRCSDLSILSLVLPSKNLEIDRPRQR